MLTLWHPPAERPKEEFLKEDMIREQKVRKEKMNVDFKESGYNGNQSLRQQPERGAVVPGGRNYICIMDGNIVIVLQTVWNTNHFQEWQEKNGKASQDYILECPENHLDEFSLTSVGTGESSKSFEQRVSNHSYI